MPERPPAPGDPQAGPLHLTVTSAARMRELGSRLARLLRQGDLVVLAGPLGAGKTTFVQGIGAGLAVRGPVTSPTFVIARTHPSLRGGPDLLHADAYRLGSRLEVDDLDLDVDLDHCVTVVEWGEGLVEDLASARLQVTIGRPAQFPGAQFQAGRSPAEQADPADQGDEPRLVAVAGYGDRWRDAAESLRTAVYDPAMR